MNQSSDEHGLEIIGLVYRSNKFTLDYIKSRPKIRMSVVAECPEADRRSPSDPESITHRIYTGCNLMNLVDEECGGLMFSASSVTFIGSDNNYSKTFNTSDDILYDCLLAYEMEDKPLTKERGYPLRLIVPGWYGIHSVKYLKRIEIRNDRHRGDEMVGDNMWKRQATYLKPRAFIWLPNEIEHGRVILEGRCWVGGSTQYKTNRITKVELSFNHGLTWVSAKVSHNPYDIWSWDKWEIEHDFKPGVVVIMIRATDNNISQPIKTIYGTRDNPSNILNYTQSIRINVK